MRVKVISGKTVADAMASIRASLGPDALILGQQKLADGSIELTAAVDTDNDATDVSCPDRIWVPPERSPLRPPRSLSRLETDRGVLSWHGAPEFVRDRLRSAGSLRHLIRECSFPALGAVLTRQPVVLAGMVGGGKTTVAIRLAVRLVIAGVKPVIINCDDRRAGADQQIRAYARLLGVDIICAAEHDDIGSCIRSLGAAQPVIVDTVGLSAIDPQTVDPIGKLARHIGGALVHVIPAGLDALESVDFSNVFLKSGARHTVVTRVDTHRRLGGLIAMAVAGIPISELGLSDAVAGGGKIMDPESFLETIEKIPYAASAPTMSLQVRHPSVSRRGAALLAQHISAQREN